jgi:CDP-diacylglycerol--serine O-phosphatidyltransferase
MNSRRKLFAVFPTMLTLGNLVCGFGSITISAKLVQSDNTLPFLALLGTTAAREGQGLLIAAVLIYVAMIFDALDGSVARLTNQTSEFGANLDSLCDIVSFGIAPAFLMLQFTRISAPHALWEDPGSHLQRLLFVIAALYAVCAALRLARFNSETDEEDSHQEFSGLPSPAAASVVASIPISYLLLVRSPDPTVVAVADWPGQALQLALPLVTLAVACLMVSRIRYVHAVNHLLRGRRGRAHMIKLVFALAVVYWQHEVAIPMILCWYAFAPPIRSLYQMVFRRRTPDPSEL